MKINPDIIEEIEELIEQYIRETFEKFLLEERFQQAIREEVNHSIEEYFRNKINDKST